MAIKLRNREKFSAYSLVMWGGQGNVAKGWFRSAEVWGADHPDAELPTKADESVDFILAANILERSPNHRATVVDLVRVLSSEGLLMLSYASPIIRKTTEDWGYPDKKRDSSYRTIGRDFEVEFAKVVPNAIVFNVREADPVTGDPDIVYVATKNPFWMRQIFQIDWSAKLLD